MIKRLSLAVLSLVFLTDARAAEPPTHLRCMAPILDFVLKDFHASRKKGLVVEDNETEKMVNLGSIIEEQEVSIHDAHKNMFVVEINLSSVNYVGIDAFLRVNVNQVDYETCRFPNRKPKYTLYRIYRPDLRN